MCVCRRYYRWYAGDTIDAIHLILYTLPHIIYPTSYYIPYLILYTLPVCAYLYLGYFFLIALRLRVYDIVSLIFYKNLPCSVAGGHKS